MVKSLVRSCELNKSIVHDIFLQTRSILDNDTTKESKPLKGKTVCLFFEEDSTRTRLSFEQAAQELGAYVIHFPVQQSSLKKGESWQSAIDTLIALGAP
jgi:aspartate carbamoyltransferase catalytic subunit